MLKIYNQYQEYGVEGYYKHHSSTYFNPHQEKIIILYKKHIESHIPRNGIILDIACGDGLIEKIIKNNNIKILLGESVLDKIKTLSLQKKNTFYHFGNVL